MENHLTWGIITLHSQRRLDFEVKNPVHAVQNRPNRKRSVEMKALTREKKCEKMVDSIRPTTHATHSWIELISIVVSRGLG